MAQNAIYPAADPSSQVKSGLDDPHGAAFVEIITQESINPLRMAKMRELEDDLDTLDDISLRLFSRRHNYKDLIQGNAGAAPRNEYIPSPFYKGLRVFHIDADELPRTYAVGPSEQDINTQIVEHIKDTVYKDANIKGVIKDLTKMLAVQGDAFVQVGVKDGEYVGVETCEPAEMFMDSTAQAIAGQGVKRNREALWVARKVQYKYGEFIGMYPEFEGKVVPGDPTSGEMNEAKSRDSDHLNNNDADRVTVLYCYSIVDPENPVEMVLAGKMATIIQKNEGKNYTFWQRKQNNKKVAILPFIDFHYSESRRGMWGPSYMTLVKDGARIIGEVMGITTDYFPKLLNKIIMLMGPGATDENVKRQMAEAVAAQRLGMNAVVPLGSGQNVDMKTVSPDGGIIQEGLQAYRFVMQDLSEKTGIDLVSQSAPQRTATVFIGKNAAQRKAIAGVHKNNIPAYNKLATCVIAAATDILKLNNAQVQRLDVKGGVSIEMTKEMQLKAFREWVGTFETDADLAMPVPTADKAQAVEVMMAQISNTFYAKQYTSMEEIELDVEGLAALAEMRGVGDIFTRSRIQKKAESLLKSQIAQQQMAEPSLTGPQSQAAEPDQTIEERVQEEFSPQAFAAANTVTS